MLELCVGVSKSQQAKIHKHQQAWSIEDCLIHKEIVTQQLQEEGQEEDQEQNQHQQQQQILLLLWRVLCTYSSGESLRTESK